LNAKPFRRRHRARFRLSDGLPLLVVAGLLALILGAQYPPVSGFMTPILTGQEPFGGTVRRVIDGDGIVVGTIEVRLGDFDAPEWNERGGQSATRALTNLALGKHVECVPCEGARRAGQCTSYDRIIATCRLDGRRLGDLMRSRGIAEGGR
jgi:endonuclease YncB( thermonuclease family)